MPKAIADLPVCILAGGLGKRLGPLTASTPKPMMRVDGKPFLELQMRHFAGLGFTRFVLAVSFCWEQIRDYFADGAAFGWTVQYSIEPQSLGTGGAVALAQPLWGERALVTNGDTFLAEDWRQMIAAHQVSGLPATLALAWQNDCSRYGRVEIAGGRVTQFIEKGNRPDAGWVNAGTYVIERQALAKHAPGTAFSLETDLFPQWIGQLGAYQCQLPFTDIGTPESLEAFRQTHG